MLPVEIVYVWWSLDMLYDAIFAFVPLLLGTLIIHLLNSNLQTRLQNKMIDFQEKMADKEKTFQQKIADKEEKKRKSDYRLIILKHTNPLRQYLIKLGIKEGTEDKYIRRKLDVSSFVNSVLRQVSVENYPGQLDLVLNKVGILNGGKTHLFFQHITSYPLFRAEFPVAYNLIYSLYIYLAYCVGKIYSVTDPKVRLRDDRISLPSNEFFKFLFETISSLHTNLLTVSSAIIEYIFMRDEDALWNMHKKEISSISQFHNFTSKDERTLSSDEYVHVNDTFNICEELNRYLGIYNYWNGLDGMIRYFTDAVNNTNVLFNSIEYTYYYRNKDIHGQVSFKTQAPHPKTD